MAQTLASRPELLCWYPADDRALRIGRRPHQARERLPSLADECLAGGERRWHREGHPAAEPRWRRGQIRTAPRPRCWRRSTAVATGAATATLKWSSAHRLVTPTAVPASPPVALRPTVPETDNGLAPLTPRRSVARHRPGRRRALGWSSSGVTAPTGHVPGPAAGHWSAT